MSESASPIPNLGMLYKEMIKAAYVSLMPMFFSRIYKGQKADLRRKEQTSHNRQEAYRSQLIFQLTDAEGSKSVNTTTPAMVPALTINELINN